MGTILRIILRKEFFIFYFALGLAFFLIFLGFVANASCEKSIFLTVGLMTGSDPNDFKDTIEPYKFIWVLAWAIHIVSWLFIPAVIGLILTNTAEQIKHEERLGTALDIYLQEEGIAPQFLNDVKAEINSQLKAFKE